MAQIRIDIESLRSNSTQLTAKITELQNLNTRLENLIGRIEASWDGQSSITYIGIMRGYANKAVKMVDVLTEYKKYVDSAIEKFSNVDKSAAGRIRGSF